MEEKKETRLPVTLEEEPTTKKPSFFSKHKDKIKVALAAAGGAVITFVICAVAGRAGRDTIACGEEEWAERKQFEDEVGGSFNGADL